MKYKNLKSLLLIVLDNLRIAITASILLQKGKEELIDMAEDSLIDNQRADQMASWLSTTKEIIR
jgi:hypothetical protein